MATCFHAGGIRPHKPQRHAIASAIRGFRGTHPTQLIVLPTGVGKTIVFGFIARFVSMKMGGNVLILAHREELIGQAAEKLSRLDVDTAIEKAERRALDMALLGRRVVIGSVQTLQGRRLASWKPDHFKLIIVDEAHHATADTYGKILRHFSGAWVLGVTATDRSDGSKLGKVFGRIAYQMTLRKAIEDGWLCKVNGVRAGVKIDLQGIRTTGGDFNAEDLAARVSMAIEPLAIGIKTEVGDRKTIAFTPDVRSAQALADALCQIGIGARAVWGESATRSADLAAFKAGDFQVLTNCSLLNEGYDEPSIAAVAICRPTKSMTLLTQMVGRGTRLADGKPDCLIVDFGWVIKDRKLKSAIDLFSPDDAKPEDIDEAKAKVKDGQAFDPKELIERARIAREAKEAAAAKRERDRLNVWVKDREVKYDRISFDPIGVGRIMGVRPAEAREGVALMPASPDLARRLSGLGVKAAESMSQRDAEQMERILLDQQDAGFASLPQINRLVQLGFGAEEARYMTKREASARIGEKLARFRARSGY